MVWPPAVQAARFLLPRSIPPPYLLLHGERPRQRCVPVMHQRGGSGNVDCQPRARHVNPFTVRSCWCVTGVGAPYLSHGGLPVDNGGLAMDTSIPLLFLRPTSPSSVSTSLSFSLFQEICSRRRRSCPFAAGHLASLFDLTAGYARLHRPVPSSSGTIMAARTLYAVATISGGFNSAVGTSE